MTNINSDQIREHVRQRYLEPARRNGQRQFTVRCGTVEKELGMSSRINHVCSALKSRKFLEPNGLRLVDTSGPPSGMSTTVTYTYEITDSRTEAPQSTITPSPAAPVTSIYEKLRQMEGILKDVYKELGGAEKAIREEREGYSR